MRILMGSMWNYGEKRRFSHLSNKVPDNKWDWYLYEREAVGIAPQDMSMTDFEERVLSTVDGLKLSWEEVRLFSTSVSDINSCFLAALLKPLHYNVLESGDFSFCLALVTVSDGTSWEIKLRNDDD